MSQDVCGETRTRPNLQQLLPEIDPAHSPGEEILSQVLLPEVRSAVPAMKPIHTGGPLSHRKELTYSLVFTLLPSGASSIPLIASLKPRMPFPSPCPSSGSFRGPKMSRAIARTKIKCVGWNKPSIMGKPLFSGLRMITAKRTGCQEKTSPHRYLSVPFTSH